MGGKSSKNNKKEESAPDEQQQQEEEQQQQASLLDQLADRAVVILTSKMSGKALRITEDGVDALGIEEDSQFTVHRKESDSGLVVALQSKEKWLQIKEDQLAADEKEGELSDLKVTEAESCVVLESTQTPGQYVAAQEDGSGQVVSELSPAAHFSFVVKAS